MLVPLAAAFGCAHHNQETAMAENPPAAQYSTEQAVPPANSPPLNEQHATQPEVASADSVACQPLRVFFDFDKAVLSDASKAALDRAGTCLKSNDKMEMIIIGNADRVGTEEYNQALGERRAQAVADYLESKGIDATQLKTSSYGKDRPICNGTTEDCDQRNRRAAIKICHM
jgi:peptidoglycan-associated lipoprotein